MRLHGINRQESQDKPEGIVHTFPWIVTGPYASCRSRQNHLFFFDIIFDDIVALVS